MEPPQSRDDSMRGRSTPIELFAGREKQLGTLADAVLGLTDEAGQIITVYGEAGQGKTLLCQRFLQDVATDGSLNANLNWGFVDLTGTQSVQPLQLLLTIRNALAKAGQLKFPAFDIAFELLWRELHRDRPLPKMERRWIETASELVAEGSKTAGEFGIAVSVALHDPAYSAAVGTVGILAFVLKKIGGWTIRKGHEHLLFRTNKALSQLLNKTGELVSPHEIELRLPYLFASDLDAWRENHPHDRFMIAIDEYDSLLEFGGASDLLRGSGCDEIVRKLVANCKATLFVFFSREALRWDEFDIDWKPFLAGRQHALPGLPPSDADRVLKKAGVDDQAIRSAMVEAITDEDPQTKEVTAYPIMLDMQLDIYHRKLKRSEPIEASQFRISARGFSAKLHELMRRILRSYRPELDHTFRYIAVARRFDRSLFEFIIDKFRTGLPAPEWLNIVKLSLLRATAEDGVYRFHDVIREALQAFLPEGERSTAHTALFNYYAGIAQVENPRDVTTHHVAAAVEAFYHKRHVDRRLALVWWDHAGKLILAAGMGRAVESIDRQTVEIAAALEGENSEEHALKMSALAANLVIQGRNEEAEGIHRKALEAAETLYPPGHVNIAMLTSNLALSLQALERFDEAHDLFLRALAIFLKRRAYSYAAATLGNLALDLERAQRYEEAEAMHRRALAMLMDDPGPEIGAIAIALNKLGSNLTKQSRLLDAEKLFQQALTIQKNTLPRDHRLVANTLSHLALNLDQQGQHHRANELHRRALEILQSTSSPNDQETGSALSSLASNLDGLGRHAEAEDLHRNSLAIYEATSGPSSLNTAACCSHLALNLDAQGRHAEAEVLHRRVLALREKILGPTDKDTGSALSHLGSCLDKQGRQAEAGPIHARALSVHEQTLGRQHLYLARTALRAACNLFALQRNAEGCELCTRAYQTRLMRLGPDNPLTIEASSLMYKHCSTASNLGASAGSGGF